MKSGRPKGSLNKATIAAATKAARPPIPVIHARDAGANIRVWDFRSGEVGQFAELSRTEYRDFIRLYKSIGVVTFIMHHDDCDGHDDKCDCPQIDKF